MPKNTFYDYIPLLEILNEAIVIYDNDRIIWANEDYAKLRGYVKATDVIGTSMRDAVHPEEFNDAKKALLERARTGKGTKGTWRVKQKDGSYRPLVCHTTALPGLDNQITMAVVRPLNN